MLIQVFWLGDLYHFYIDENAFVCIGIIFWFTPSEDDFVAVLNVNILKSTPKYTFIVSYGAHLGVSTFYRPLAGLKVR